MQSRTQWTLVGTAMVLGWGAGLAGAGALNDAETPSSFGAAVTLDTAARSGAFATARPTATEPTQARKAGRAGTDSPATRPARRKPAPQAVPAPAPRRVVADSPVRAPAPATNDSADSAESANSAD